MPIGRLLPFSRILNLYSLAIFFLNTDLSEIRKLNKKEEYYITSQRGAGLWVLGSGKRAAGTESPVSHVRLLEAKEPWMHPYAE